MILKLITKRVKVTPLSEGEVMLEISVGTSEDKEHLISQVADKIPLDEVLNSYGLEVVEDRSLKFDGGVLKVLREKE